MKYIKGEIVNNIRISKEIDKAKRVVYEGECLKCGFNSDMKYYKKGILQEKRWSITKGNLKAGKGCPCCSSKVVVTNINSIWKIDCGMISLGVNEEFAKKYTVGSSEKAPCKCPDCGREFKKSTNTIYNRRSISCNCRDGIPIPEKVIMAILSQLNIEYETQYKPNWSNNKKYDFYIRELNLIIETHGSQHPGTKHHDNRGFSDLIGARSIKEEGCNDTYKKKLAIQNGVKEENYIAIDCSLSNLDFIRNNVLNSNFAKLYNLTNIDWGKVWEFSINSNLSKKACDIWNDNSSITTTDISSIIGVSNTTVSTWLKRWTQIGLCNYNPKDEVVKIASKTGKMNGKPVEIIDKHNVSKGKFYSASELERQSKELFGVKLLQTKISACCRNDNHGKDTYKNFRFQYILGNDNIAC